MGYNEASPGQKLRTKKFENTIPCVKTAIPGPKSRELLERRLKSVPRGVSYNNTVFVSEGKGALLKDVDGNVFVDFAAGIGVINVGYGNDEIIEAIARQAGAFTHTSINVLMYEPYIALAEKLNELVPGSTPKKTMFANSGAEAVENAVKIVRKYTGKSGIVSLESSFHGRTYMAMTLTSKVEPYKDGFAPFNSDTYKIPSPNVYRSPISDATPELVGEACAKHFEDMLATSLSPNMIAAVILEPVQGEGGFIVLPDHYLRRIREICTKNDILLIVDEIQTGFARCGTLFACESAGIEPDLITLSKSIAGGLPLSAVVGKEEIMEAPIPGAIGGTFCGNPVSCAAALKVLEIIEKENLCQKAQKLGDYMQERLRVMQKKHIQIGDVRGKGAMVAIEFVNDPVSKEPYSAIVKQTIAECLQNGVVLLSAGLFGNCIRFLPPLVMTREQAVYGMDVLEVALDKLL